MPAARLRVWALSSRLTHCTPWLFARPLLYLTQEQKKQELWCALFRNKTIVCSQLCIISLRAPRASLSALINPASTHNAPTADCKACLLASSITLGLEQDQSIPVQTPFPVRRTRVRMIWYRTGTNTVTSCSVTWETSRACGDGGSSEGWGV